MNGHAIDNASQTLSTPILVAAIDSFTDGMLFTLQKWETDRRLRWIPGAEFPVYQPTPIRETLIGSEKSRSSGTGKSPAR